MKITGWTFVATLAVAFVGTPALAQTPAQGQASKKAVPPSHLPKPHKQARQDKAKPPATSPKR
ncbi:hypothetical protein [Sphingomonas azotifigens]|uniref:hypothetical protein n=1 Tax=Sphingomonas azotifigens TaxID=330920 RepID=UPI0009FC475E|nr:hypothetical protein [Sphingomonas azotifigens]